MLLEFNSVQVAADLNRGIDLAIPLRFDATQPRFFGAPPASGHAVQMGDFYGDTRAGGSCNVDHLRLTPHCNGTHTECIGHVVDADVSVFEALSRTIYQATLISVTPKPDQRKNSVITGAALETALAEQRSEPANPALIIRTLPNSPMKRQRDYGIGEPPAYIEAAGAAMLVEQGVQHLLVDLPSIDPPHDQGRLHAHRIFWGLPPESHRLAEARTERAACTITEMIFVPDHVTNGHYLLDLHIPAFRSDAAPSRPLIYPYHEISR